MAAAVLRRSPPAEELLARVTRADVVSDAGRCGQCTNLCTTRNIYHNKRQLVKLPVAKKLGRGECYRAICKML